LGYSLGVVVPRLWFAPQMLFLAISSQKVVEEIRFREIIIAALAPASCLITGTVLVVLSIMGNYHLGPFQQNMWWAFFSASVFNAGIGGAVRLRP